MISPTSTIFFTFQATGFREWKCIEQGLGRMLIDTVAGIYNGRVGQMARQK